MRILAIETSCDETAIAIADFFGPKTQPDVSILSNLVSSQAKLHAKFGGVVPNLAKREHQKNLVPVLLQALRETGLKIFNFPARGEARQRWQFSIFKQISKSKIQRIEKVLEREPGLLKQFKKHLLRLPPPQIDAIAVTYGPGLAPALWVGVNFTKALAFLWDKPLIPVNHMAGHLYSAFLQKSGVENFQFSIFNFQFPALALLVSGGHTELVLMRGHGKFKIIGETLDDAAGEAFDKVARILGLGYPGGPFISAEAEKNQKAKIKNKNADSKLKIKLPRPMLNSNTYDFSFSGLKTAVLYLVRDLGKKKVSALRPAIAEEFQNAAVEVLVKKTIRAAKEYRVKTILLGGGVAANKLLRQKLEHAVENSLSNVTCQISDVALSGDNALMIAAAAYFAGKKKAPNEVGANANLKLC